MHRIGENEMCKPGMAEWAWMRRIALNQIEKEANQLFPDGGEVRDKFIQNEIEKFDSGRLQHDQMINSAMGGPGSSTI